MKLQQAFKINSTCPDVIPIVEPILSHSSDDLHGGVAVILARCWWWWCDQTVTPYILQTATSTII